MVVVAVAGWQMAPLLSFAQSALMAALQGLWRPADLMQCSQTRTIIRRHYGATLWVYLEMCWLLLPSEDLHSSSHTLWRSSLLFCLQATVKSNLVNYCGIFSLPQLAVMVWLARELHDASYWWFINGFIGLQHLSCQGFCAGLHTVFTSGQEWRSP